MTGVVVMVSEKKNLPTGMTQGRGKAKVAYQDGHGGMGERWVDLDKLEPVVEKARRAKDIEEAKNKELEAVAEKSREATDWYEQAKAEDEQNIAKASNVNKGVATGVAGDDTTFIG